PTRRRTTSSRSAARWARNTESTRAPAAPPATDERPGPLRSAPPPRGLHGPRLLEEPRGAGGHAAVPGVPAPRGPRAGVLVRRSRGPPRLPQDDGGLAGAGRARRLHPA